MATNTTNLSLIKPAGTDKVRIAQINQNMDILDEKIGPVGNTSVQDQIIANDSGMAIVSTGNTHSAIASGEYVYIRSHGTLAEGMYKANSAISANATLSTSNVTRVSSGGMNDLKEQIDSLNSKLTQIQKTTITGTLTSGGSITTGLQNKAILGVVIKNASAVLTGCTSYTSGGVAWITVYDIRTMQHIGAEEVSIDLYYCDFK